MGWISAVFVHKALHIADVHPNLREHLSRQVGVARVSQGPSTPSFHAA